MTQPVDSAALVHSIAIKHLPPFITQPGETDILFVTMALFVLFAVIGIGVFYFKLHALPEQLAHRGQKVQFEIVAVLGLISLFTHNHLFWIAGLLLAIVPLPDLTSPLRSIANSLDRLAAAAPPRAVPFPPDPPPAPHAHEAPPAHEAPQPDHRPTGPQGG
jgi:hypothetical protein